MIVSWGVEIKYLIILIGLYLTHVVFLLQMAYFTFCCDERTKYVYYIMQVSDDNMLSLNGNSPFGFLHIFIFYRYSFNLICTPFCCCLVNGFGFGISWIFKILFTEKTLNIFFFMFCRKGHDLGRDGHHHNHCHICAFENDDGLTKDSRGTQSYGWQKSGPLLNNKTTIK